jgi:phage repressor protein C with HTH and peptisase S24 domain
LTRKGGKPDNMSLIKVSGDSMEPTLLTGDLVLVDHGRNSIASQGGIYAIAINDEIMIKRVQPAFPDKLLVISDNKQYSSFEISKDKVRVNGKVIWYAREMER